MTSALVVVDVQNDFCEGGTLAVAGGAGIASAITEHVNRLGHEYDFIVASKDWHIQPGEHWATVHNELQVDYKTVWPVHCPAGLKGSNFHPDLNVTFSRIFLKGQYEAAYSAFDGKSLLAEGLDIGESALGVYLGEWLRGHSVRNVYVCGIALDYCVAATVRDSVKQGFNTTLLPFLTVAVDTDNYETIWRNLQRETGCSISVR